MKRVPLDERGAVWLIGIVAVTVLLVAAVAPAVAAAVLAVCALVFRVAWWMPWALGVALVAVAPILVLRGNPAAADTAATMVVACMTIAVGLVVAERLRSGR